MLIDAYRTLVLTAAALLASGIVAGAWAAVAGIASAVWMLVAGVAGLVRRGRPSIETSDGVANVARVGARGRGSAGARRGGA